MKNLNQTKAISPRVLLWLMQTKRYRLILVLLITLISISFIVRLVLMISSWSQLDGSISNVLLIFLVGLFFDLANASYFLVPIIVLLWLTPDRFVRSKGFYYAQLFLYFLLAFVLLFSAGAEYFFWSEFNSRFNFIAVDYLIYTTEVIGNIKQSYPIEWIMLGQLTLVFLLTWLVHHFLKKAESNSEPDFRQRSIVTATWIGIVVLVFFTLDVNTHRFSTNRYVNELSGNGIYELFAAYRNNELNYEQFYATIHNDEAATILQSKFEYPSASNEFQKTFPLHQVVNKNQENKWNVVLISVESLSAEFLGLFGNKKKITPHLDSLAAHSLVFTNLFATGTRTVRGLEALTLSIPPTPGQSIVRRPNNENLFSLGSVFKDKGYQCKYIYGGYGYFDNMNYFFEQNNYQVIDRSAIADNEIDYENIWGVADENLFELSLKEIDKSVNENQLIFAHIMTTSNHRPYTYPEGRIDIPSHTSREGAVKYTDYAIGKFLREASSKPWYNNTLFIIIADHCASSAGKVDLPLNKYKIPMLILGPGFKPQVNNTLMSQIDVAPTILGLLNFSYLSKFYGYDILRINPDEARAFISTYQTLGYLRGDSMIVLKPQQKLELYLQDQKGDFTQSPTDSLNTLRVTKEAISWYQNSSLAFKTGLLKK